MEREFKDGLFFSPSFYFERSTAKEGSRRGEPRLLTDVWLLADGRYDNKTIASEVTKAVPNNEGLTDQQWDFSLYFWSFCASLKNRLILMVSVSMVWPGLLAALILIVYCINMRKKKTIPVTSTMITGFFRSSRQEESIGFPSYFSGDVFISHVFFMLYFYHVHTSPFPVI